MEVRLTGREGQSCDCDRRQQGPDDAGWQEIPIPTTAIQADFFNVPTTTLSKHRLEGCLPVTQRPSDHVRKGPSGQPYESPASGDVLVSAVKEKPVRCINIVEM